MHCPECGKKNSVKNKFCTHCGKKFEKSLKTKKEKDYVWTCDFCDQEFDTKKESDKHELTCKKNPNNRKILLRIKIPNKETIFGVTFIFLLFYFLTYLLVNSYAKTNGLKEKTLTNPFSWFLSEVKKETPLTLIPTPTENNSTPTPKAKTQPKNTNINNNQNYQIECIGPDGKHFNTSIEECEKLNKSWNKPVNYMVNCKMSQNCSSDTRWISKLECDNGVCCQVGSSWNYFSSEDTCRRAQGNNQQTNQPSEFIYQWPIGKYSICPMSIKKQADDYMFDIIRFGRSLGANIPRDNPDLIHFENDKAALTKLMESSCRPR